jgi:hypothetical protein
MKREGCVVINTGNFLHSFAVDLEKLRYRYLVFSHQLYLSAEGMLKG